VRVLGVCLVLLGLAFLALSGGQIVDALRFGLLHGSQLISPFTFGVLIDQFPALAVIAVGVWLAFRARRASDARTMAITFIGLGVAALALSGLSAGEAWLIFGAVRLPPIDVAWDAAAVACVVFGIWRLIAFRRAHSSVS
jgi:hypothetical protein